jgi:hypothetical protein
MAYCPPHKRCAQPVAAAVPTPVPVSNQSHHDWLREQQARAITTIKTPEQRKAELASLTFQELRARAGPGPAVDGFDFWSEECGHSETQGRAYAAQLNFSSDLTNYRKNGSCPPPPPLDYTSTFADWAAGGRQKAAAYEEWYNMWGKLLVAKWHQEHPLRLTTPSARVTSVAVPSRPVNVTDESPPRRPIIITDKSGW